LKIDQIPAEYANGSYVNVGIGAVQKVAFGNSLPVAFICGPCAIESRDLAFRTAEAIKRIGERQKVGVVYKSSFDKANRTSVEGRRGLGIEEGLRVLQEVRQEFQLPVLTDIHTAEQASIAAEVVDIVQIPALLCRQTDIISAAASTRCVVNIKKGQFLSPEEMLQVAAKIKSFGKIDVLLTERGTSFGYNNLVSDFRALPILATAQFPVVFDATHSVQLPGAAGSSTSGKREFVEVLTRAAVAVGVAGVFMETHPDPDRAISDGPNMVPLEKLEQLIASLRIIDDISKSTVYAGIR